MKRSSHIARTLGIGVSAFLVSVLSTQALTVIHDVEAEKATYEGMQIEKIDGVSHLIAEEKYNGSITFPFTLESNGTYRIEAKTIAPSTSEDSFEVSLDGGSKEVWHVPRSTTWQWNQIKTADGNNGIYELEAGSHTLVLYGREQTRIDRLKITMISDPEEGEGTEKGDEHISYPIVDSDGENSEGVVNEEEIEAEEPITEVPTVPETEELDSISSGNTLYVSTSGDDDNNGSESKPFRTIQKALDKVTPGDTILVAAGTYKEEIETVRDGEKSNPITLKAQSSKRPVIDLKWDGNGPRLVNDYYIFEGFEVKNFRQGLRVEGASNVIVRNNLIHHGEHECVRVRYFASDNVIEKNTVHFCGAKSPTERIKAGNGEAIYIGTAPEQRERNGGKADLSLRNKIIGNTIYDVSESVDIKEDSSYTEVRNNEVYRNSDHNSGAINVRGDDNLIIDNYAHSNEGSGFRFGGDQNIEDPDGKTHDYGINNTVRDNFSKNNSQYGYKFMMKEQKVDCSNASTGNKEGNTNGGFEMCFRSL